MNRSGAGCAGPALIFLVQESKWFLRCKKAICFMNEDFESMSTEEMVAALSEASGIPFQIAEGEMDEATLRARLSALLHVYRSASDRNEIFVRFLTGQTPAEDFRPNYPHFTTDAAESDPMALFVISITSGDAADTLSILAGLFPPPRNTLVRIDEKTIVLIHEPGEGISADELASIANMIHETLQTEGLVSSCVAYDAVVTGFRALPASYTRAAAALHITSLFALPEPCPGYRTLGLNKLVSRLPKDACEEYLAEQFPGFSFSELSSETINTINTLFENGLNLAETARSMYVHRNTLVYRIEKFSKESGLDLRNFDDAVRCRIGMLITKFLDAQ